MTYKQKSDTIQHEQLHYPLVNSHITMGNRHAINGKINYLELGHFLCRYVIVITRG